MTLNIEIIKPTSTGYGNWLDYIDYEIDLSCNERFNCGACDENNQIKSYFQINGTLTAGQHTYRKDIRPVDMLSCL